MKVINKNPFKDSLYKNSLFLMISSGVMSVLGFFFWIICARIYPSEQVGLATTMISVGSLIVSFSILGMNSGLIRYLPDSTNRDNKINTVLTLSIISTIIFSSIFLIGVNKFSPRLEFIKESIIMSFGFIGFMIVLAGNSVIESVFVALRNAKFVFVKSTIFGILKLGFPFLFVGFGAYGIFGSYVFSLGIALLCVFFVLIFKFNYKPKFVFYDRVIKKIGKYSFGNYIAGFLSGLSLLVLPLMVTNLINAKTTAYYFMSVQIATLLFVIPNATTSSLFAEGSNNEKKLKEYVKKSILIVGILLIPAILGTIILGQYILLAFGKEYSLEGFNFLRIMAISALFVGINSIFSGVLKIKNKIGKIIFANAIGAIIILGGSYLLIKKGMGLNGIGIAYLGGQIAMNLSYLLLNIKKK